MTTWLDWYVRSRMEAPESRPGLAHQMKLGATNPLMAFAETIEELLAAWTVDRTEFVRMTGIEDRKSQEEFAIRVACLSPFLGGFASPDMRKLRGPGRPLGIVLTRETLPAREFRATRPGNRSGRSFVRTRGSKGARPPHRVRRQLLLTRTPPLTSTCATRRQRCANAAPGKPRRPWKGPRSAY